MSIGNRHRGRVTRRRAPRGARTAFFAACFLVVPLIGGCADETAPPMVITAIEPATVSALVAQNMGAGKPREANLAINQLFTIAVAASIVLGVSI